MIGNRRMLRVPSPRSAPGSGRAENPEAEADGEHGDDDDDRQAVAAAREKLCDDR